MKESSTEALKTHPIIIFWIGLLTGALIVGLVFLYRFMNPTQVQSDLLRYLYYPTTTIAPTRTLDTTSTINPIRTYDNTMLDTTTLNALPTPPGG